MNFLKRKPRKRKKSPKNPSKIGGFERYQQSYQQTNKRFRQGDTKFHFCKAFLSKKQSCPQTDKNLIFITISIIIKASNSLYKLHINFVKQCPLIF